MPFLANYGTNPYSLIFLLSPHCYKYSYKINTEPFRNGLVETRNRTIRASRKPGTSPKCCEMIMMKYVFWAVLWIFVLFYVTRRIINIIILLLFLLLLLILLLLLLSLILVFSFYGKTFDFLFILVFIVSARELTTLMSISNGLGSYFCHRKMGKTQPMMEEMDGKVSNSHQSRHFLSL